MDEVIVEMITVSPKGRKTTVRTWGKLTKKFEMDDYRRLFEAEKIFNELTTIRVHVDIPPTEVSE